MGHNDIDDNDSPGFIDHQPHHDAGNHLDDEPFDVLDARDDVDAHIIRVLVDSVEQHALDDLRRNFIDALADDRAAAKLAAALRHPSTGNRSR